MEAPNRLVTDPRYISSPLFELQHQTSVQVAIIDE